MHRAGRSGNGHRWTEWRFRRRRRHRTTRCRRWLATGRCPSSSERRRQRALTGPCAPSRRRPSSSSPTPSRLNTWPVWRQRQGEELVEEGEELVLSMATRPPASVIATPTGPITFRGLVSISKKCSRFVVLPINYHFNRIKLFNVVWYKYFFVAYRF